MKLHSIIDKSIDSNATVCLLRKGYAIIQFA